MTLTMKNLKRCRNAESLSLVDDIDVLVKSKKMRSDAAVETVSVEFNMTDVNISSSVDLKLESTTESKSLKCPQKEPCSSVRESRRVDEADSEGLVDVHISYVTDINGFSKTMHGIVSTSVVAEIEDSNKCLGEQKKSEFVLEETNDNCKLPVFCAGDIVWAKSGIRGPLWPAIVINHMTDAPEAVLKCCVPDAFCVKYFGYSKNGNQREYAWVKHKWIFPFLENKQRFEGQTRLFNRRPNDFHIAIKEAVLAGSASTEASSGIFIPTCSITLEEASSSNLIQESESQVLLRKGKLQCSICHKAWKSSDGGNSEFENGVYQCPNCRSNLNASSSQLVKGKPKVLINSGKRKNRPGRLPVICNGIDGIYFPDRHLVKCMCGCCRTKEITLNEWERHTGSRAKKWKSSVKVKDTMSPLGKWLAGYDDLGVDSSKLTSEQILKFLQETYKPITAKWTLEKCAVCRWAEDSDDNKIIVCNRCQIAVHQECYGARNVDSISWICRACETPDVQRECCLCPVKGGALKPTDIDRLWVHVTCAWFRPEVGFLDVIKMEPAIGILRIPPISFSKACVICKQTHGSCIKCCKCATHFHAVCAAQAGLYMELQCQEKNGVPITQKLVYCAFHRAPNKDHSLVMHTTVGMFSAKNVTQTQDKGHNIKGSSRNLTRKKELPELLSSKVEEFISDSAARCRVYKRPSRKTAGIEPVSHRPMGPRHHSLSEVEKLNTSRLGNLNMFSSFKERLQHLQRTEKHRIGIGKSAIHGWGLFARQDIQEGEMIFEYRGELVRPIIADRREAQYQVEGKDCYFFKISKDVVVDATNKGSMGRLINHSCMPNCFARIINESQDRDRIIIFAKKDLAAGDELTYDYMFDPDEKEDQKVPCLCNAPNCRKFMN